MRAESDLVVLDHVSRSFDARRIIALDDVTLAVAPAELIAVSGPSGSGKSTLVNLMSGVDLPTAGAVSFAGLTSPSGLQWARLRSSRIGLVFQDFNLLPTLTAVENVEIAMFGRRAGAARRARAMDCLTQVGVAECARRLPPELSGGERRRVGLARALANEPVLLLADEPTSNLDSGSGRLVMDLLLDLHGRAGITTVIVTHDESVMARCRRRVAMRDGRVEQDTRSAEMVPA